MPNNDFIDDVMAESILSFIAGNNQNEEPSRLRCFVVFDSSILVGALLSQPPTLSDANKLLDLVVLGSIIPLYNDELLSAYKNDLIIYNDQVVGGGDRFQTILSLITKYGLSIDDKIMPSNAVGDDNESGFFVITTLDDNDSIFEGNRAYHYSNGYKFVVSPKEMLMIRHTILYNL